MKFALAEIWTLITNWTLSKQVFQNGYNDLQQLVPQRSIYQYDQPQTFKFTAVYEICPFGPGKHFGGSTHGFIGRLIGGWEANTLFTYHSGLPWKLPTNFIFTGNPQEANINWKSSIVHVAKPCVAQWNTNGTITMQSFSVAAGCTGYDFFEPSTLCALRVTKLLRPDSHRKRA